MMLQQTFINCRGKLIDLSKPVVMGILNVNPDSFYDGGNYSTRYKALKRCEKMLEQGADIIDIGGCSTRPGAVPVSEKEERKRVIYIIRAAVKSFPSAVISVDTFRPSVAKQAVEAGASIINDISGGTIEPGMFKMVAQLNVSYILMHIQGTPSTMQVNPVYHDIMSEVMFYFSEKVCLLRQLGVSDIILDPGFGFGKTLENNFELLNRFDDFGILGLPLMAGISRKSIVNKALNIKPEDALNGTSVLHTLLLQKGVKILRVHDVKEAMEAVKLTNMLL